MDLTFIFGIIISVLLAYWGIWYTKKQRSKIELSLIDRYGVPLISTYEKSFKSLEALNYQFPFDSNQYYYRGILINTGNIDIYKSIMLKPLKLSFNEEIKIISFRLLNSNPDIEVSYKQIENEILIEWDILKPLENFSFELIVQSPKSIPVYGISKNMKLESRIAELKKVRRLSFSDLSNMKNTIGDLISNYFAFVSLLLLSTFGLFKGLKSFYHESGDVKYSITSKLHNEPVDLKYYSADSIFVDGENTDEIVGIHELNNKIQVIPEIEIKKNRYFFTTLCSLGVILCFLIIFYSIKRDIGDRKLNSIIGALP